MTAETLNNKCQELQQRLVLESPPTWKRYTPAKGVILTFASVLPGLGSVLPIVFPAVGMVHLTQQGPLEARYHEVTIFDVEVIE